MHLRVYLAEHCWGCDEARALATQTLNEFKSLGLIEILDSEGLQEVAGH